MPTKYFYWIVLIVISGHFLGSLPYQNNPVNVLFICIDDMNDWAGFLHTHPQVKTPNLDAAAHRGFYFTNAHCPAPICGPSRTAVLSGLWPTTSGSYTNKINYRTEMKNHISLPAHFRSHGYYSMGTGKIFHSGLQKIPLDAFDEYGAKAVSAQPFTSDDLRLALQTPYHEITKQGQSFRLPFNGIPADRHWGKANTFDWGSVDLPDTLFDDVRNTDWTIEQLERNFTSPFFLALGFSRPHQPLYNPSRFHKLYPPEQVKLPQHIENDLDDVPRAGREYALAASTSGLHKSVVAYGKWSQAVSSYLASISFIDEQIGRVLAALDQSKYASNTAVIIWSDHGWHLGEKEHWGKETGWLRSSRVPLIIIPPKNAQTDFENQSQIDAVVNLIDLAPTLAELTGLPKNMQWEGRSLVQLMRNADEDWSNITHTTFGYGNHSIATDEWHFIKYFDGSKELYNIKNDFHQYHNLHSTVEGKNIIQALEKHLPKEPTIRHFVRHHNYKALVPVDGSEIILFNLSYQNHINQQTDVSQDYPNVTKFISDWIDEHKPTDKHIVIE